MNRGEPADLVSLQVFESNMSFYVCIVNRKTERSVMEDGHLILELVNQFIIQTINHITQTHKSISQGP